MNLSIQLPETLEERLTIYCHTHGISEDKAIQIALHQLLNGTTSLTPYELGVEGFGADKTHCGNISKNSQRILRERFRDSIAR